ncbi:MAG: FAD synthetase family protein [Treponema sp.]|nr:FAD synthetase family protein [Treponema sp.]
MRILSWEELKDAPAGGKKTAVTIGVFDGIHRGHQELIRKITGKAPEMIPTVLTFRENPKFGVLNPQKEGNLRDFEGDIISFKEKTALFSGLGVELCVIIDFTRNFSTMKGRFFFEELCARLNPGYAAIGRNFHCGYGRDTGAEAFKALADASGFTAEIVEPVLEGALPVSSSRIRAAFREGRFEEAGLLLGRPYSGMNKE